MSEPPCVGCFRSDFEVVLICSCGSHFCPNCFDSIVNRYYENMEELKIFPVCPVCETKFNIDQFHDADWAKLYSEALVTFIKSDFYDSGPSVQRAGLDQLINYLEDLRTDKIEFYDKLDDNVKWMVKHVLKDKLKDVNKHNKAAFDTIMRRIDYENLPVCFNPCCYETSRSYTSDRMKISDRKLTCRNCKLEYCRFCNEDYYKGHKCYPRDTKKSFYYVEALIHCESCGDVSKRFSNQKRCECGVKYPKKNFYLYDFLSEQNQEKDQEPYDYQLLKMIEQYEKQPPSIQPLDLDSDLAADEFFVEYSDFLAAALQRRRFFDRILKLLELHLNRELTFSAANKIIG